MAAPRERVAGEIRSKDKEEHGLGWSERMKRGNLQGDEKVGREKYVKREKTRGG